MLRLDLDSMSDPVYPPVSPEPLVVFAKEQPAHSEVQAMAGASATLSCEVAQAQTEVTWYKDGKIPWRREWQPTPTFLPGESHGQRSLVGYSPWGHKVAVCTPPAPEPSAKRPGS